PALPPFSPLFPYTTLFRSAPRVDLVLAAGLFDRALELVLRAIPDLRRALSLLGPRGEIDARLEPDVAVALGDHPDGARHLGQDLDRKSTRLNSSHEWISYA